MQTPDTVRIILVSSDESDDRMIRRLLIEVRRPDWGFSWFRSRDAAMAVQVKGDVDVVLVGEQLGCENGLELIRQMSTRSSRCVHILLTDRDDREIREEALMAGAMETLPRKDLTAALFDRVVRAGAGQRNAKDVTRECEDRFRSIASATPLPLYVKTANGSGVFFNQCWLEFRGRGHAQECGLGWQEGIHPDEREGVLALMKNAMLQHTSLRIEYRLRRHDGQYIKMLDTAQPRFLPDGHFSGFVGVLTDQENRLRYEKDAAIAREEAVSASRLKSQFLTNISHEIRTPMNGIIGMAGLLLDTSLSPEQRELAEAVQKSADALLGVVNDILDIARIETGRLQVDAVELELRSLIEDTVGLLGERAQDKGLELLCEIDPELPTLLRGDPGRLRQVLTNIIGNAIKFTDEGEVLVSVSRVEETESVVVFRVAVRDTGIGIALEAQKLLFQPFVQADGSLTRRHGGMGLGLAISSQLVELMGGRMGVESVPEKGSVFWFELSLPKLVEGGQPGMNVHRIGGQTSALVVNTSATNRRVLLNQLAELGVAAESVASGAEALALMRSKARSGSRFDFAIIDRMLPGAGCRQLAKEIRADSALCSTALLVTTTASRLSELHDFRDGGFDTFLLKPIRLRQLRRSLMGFLRAGGQPNNQKSEKDGLFRLAESPAARSGRLRVLVVEDNYVNQKAVQRNIEKLGHSADIAENGAQALDMLAMQRYDLVVMDCLMPVLDGFETTRCIREGRVPNLDPNLPIIGLTSHENEENRQKCLAAGMDDIVIKPMRSEDFQTVLEKRLVKDGERQIIASDSQAPFEIDNVVLDPKRLAHLFGREGDDQDFIRKLIDLFLAETPRRLEEIRSAYSRGDYRTMASMVQTVQGAAANLGARSLEKHCRRIDDLVQSGRFAVLKPLVESLDEELARLASALDKERGKASIENINR